MAQLRERRQADGGRPRDHRRAFDLGVTHFDLANNHGPPCDSAEESFGRDSLAALDRLDFTEEELAEIDRGRTESDTNLWADSSRE